MCLRISLCPTCNCGGSENGLQKSTTTRIYYLVQFVLVIVLAFVLYAYGGKILHWIPELNKIPNEIVGTAVVYRLLFAVFLFHFLMGMIMIGVSTSEDSRAVLQDGLWIVKIILLLGLIVMCFFLPNNALSVIGVFALIGSGVFVLVQQVLLVDFAHQWNQAWVEKWHNTQDSSWWCMLLTVTGLFYVFALVITIVVLVLFSGCDLNIFFAVFNFVMVISVTCCSVSPAVQEKKPHSGLLQSAVVAAYTSYLVFSAVLSETGEEWDCGYDATAGANDFTTILGALFSLVAVAYSAFRVSSSAQAFDMTSSGEIEGGITKPLTADGEGKDEEAAGVVYSYSFFHFTFALAAMYAMMIITNWASLGIDDGNVMVNTGTAAVWVQIVSSWICLVLYGWTLYAPVLFPNREF